MTRPTCPTCTDGEYTTDEVRSFLERLTQLDVLPGGTYLPAFEFYLARLLSDARLDERAAVVAWLRKQRDIDGFTSVRCNAIADCIERGDHRSGGSDG